MSRHFNPSHPAASGGQYKPNDTISHSTTVRQARIGRLLRPEAARRLLEALQEAAEPARACPCCGGHLLPGWRACEGCLDWARAAALRASIRAAAEVSPATDMQTEFRRLPENLT